MSCSFPRGVRSGAVLGALAGGLLGAQPAGAASTPAAVAAVQSAWSYVPEYQAAPALDTGRLVSSTGRPVADATVIVLPVPLGAAAGMKLTPVARATTDSAGRFTIHLPRSDRGLLQTAAGRSAGYLNLHVIAFYPGETASWFVPVKAASTVAAVSNLVLRKLPAASRVRPQGSPITGCYVESTTERPNRAMTVGYKSNTKSDVDYSQFTYSKGTTETTGVGTSFTAAGSGYSVDGTTSRTSGIAVNFPPIAGGPGSNYFKVSSTWYTDFLSCAVEGAAWLEWYTAFDSVSAGDGTPGAPEVSAGYCSVATAGIANTYSTTTQETWTDGASLAGDIGINLSSQDGWSSDAELTYKLSANGAVCGVNNYPNYSSPSAGHLQTH
jgi:hypothetical protein